MICRAKASSRIVRVALGVLAIVALSHGAANEAAARHWSHLWALIPRDPLPPEPIGLTERQRAAFEAAATDDADAMTEFLHRGGNAAIRDDANHTLLQVAARAGSWRVIDALVSYPIWVSPETLRESLDAAAQGAAEGRDTTRAVRRLHRIADP